MAMRKPGPYAPLSAYYADDEAIMAAGEDAELLYIRMLAYAARTPTTEGWISDAVVTSRLGILPRSDEAGTDAGSRAGKLAESGLIIREGTGWRIRSWLRWNRSAEEMGRERVRDRNRKTSTNDGTDAGNGAGTGAGVPHLLPTAETETETEAVKTTAPRKRATRIPDDFDVTDGMRSWAQGSTPLVNLDRETANFRDYWRAKPGKDATKQDWVATWRTWMRRAQENAERRTPQAAVGSPVELNPWRLR